MHLLRHSRCHHRSKSHFFISSVSSTFCAFRQILRRCSVQVAAVWAVDSIYVSWWRAPCDRRAFRSSPPSTEKEGAKLKWLPSAAFTASTATRCSCNECTRWAHRSIRELRLKLIKIVRLIDASPLGRVGVSTMADGSLCAGRCCNKCDYMCILHLRRRRVIDAVHFMHRRRRSIERAYTCRFVSVTVCAVHSAFAINL